MLLGADLVMAVAFHGHGGGSIINDDLVKKKSKTKKHILRC